MRGWKWSRIMNCWPQIILQPPVLTSATLSLSLMFSLGNWTCLLTVPCFQGSIKPKQLCTAVRQWPLPMWSLYLLQVTIGTHVPVKFKLESWKNSWILSQQHHNHTFSFSYGWVTYFMLKNLKIMFLCVTLENIKASCLCRIVAKSSAPIQPPKPQTKYLNTINSIIYNNFQKYC